MRIVRTSLACQCRYPWRQQSDHPLQRRSACQLEVTEVRIEELSDVRGPMAKANGVPHLVSNPDLSDRERRVSSATLDKAHKLKGRGPGVATCKRPSSVKLDPASLFQGSGMFGWQPHCAVVSSQILV